MGPAFLLIAVVACVGPGSSTPASLGGRESLGARVTVDNSQSMGSRKRSERKPGSYHQTMAADSVMRTSLPRASMMQWAWSRREVLALITDGIVVRAILTCLGLLADAPVIHPARGSPELF
jgi:hypothetical protein